MADKAQLRVLNQKPSQERAGRKAYENREGFPRYSRDTHAVFTRLAPDSLFFEPKIFEDLCTATICSDPPRTYDKRFRLRNLSPGIIRIRWEPLPGGTLLDPRVYQGKASRKAYPVFFRHLAYTDGTTGPFVLSGIPAGTRVGVKGRFVRRTGEGPSSGKGRWSFRKA